MKSLILRFMLFIALLNLGFSFGQQQSARLIVEKIEGYQFPTIINPTILTSPAEQMEGVLVEDVVDIRVFPSANPQSEVHASISKVYNA
jgi:hypothetical protein